MKQPMKKTIKKLSLYYALQDSLRKRRQVKELREWERDGRPVPPPHIIKQRMLADYAGRFGLKILVETGTYHGDMIEAMKDTFDHLYSIELSHELYQRAAARFRKAGHIELIQGDSGVEIGNIIKKIRQPALFWLDGHYSAGETARGEKETPVFEELSHILDTPERGHVIIIDDALCFGTDPAYPDIEALIAFIRSKRPNVKIEILDDSIRITPEQ